MSCKFIKLWSIDERVRWCVKKRLILKPLCCRQRVIPETNWLKERQQPNLLCNVKYSSTYKYSIIIIRINISHLYMWENLDDRAHWKSCNIKLYCPSSAYCIEKKKAAGAASTNPSIVFLGEIICNEHYTFVIPI